MMILTLICRRMPGGIAAMLQAGGLNIPIDMRMLEGLGGGDGAAANAIMQASLLSMPVHKLCSTLHPGRGVSCFPVLDKNDNSRLNPDSPHRPNG